MTGMVKLPSSNPQNNCILHGGLTATFVYNTLYGVTAQLFHLIKCVYFVFWALRGTIVH